MIGAPGIETRYPIDQLQSQFPDVFNMFIIALEAMQKLSESGDIRFGAPHNTETRSKLTPTVITRLQESTEYQISPGNTLYLLEETRAMVTAHMTPSCSVTGTGHTWS